MNILGGVDHQRGQVGIIILLIVVVMSTIGISVASRSSTDVSISKSTEDANRAFDAAESGAEKALSDSTALNPGNTTQATGTISTIPNVNVNYTVDKLTTLSTIVDEGFSASLDVTSAGAGQSIDINWATETSCAGQTPASLIITIYSTIGTSPAYRKVYAGACAHAPADGFTIEPAGNISGYFRHVTIALLNTDALVRIRPVYNQTALRVGGVGWNLSTQQFRVTSTAQSALNKETKAVQVERTVPMAPSVFDFTLFSGGAISN